MHLSQVATEHGVTGLYAGIGATGLRQASGVGVRFALYGRVKVRWACGEMSRESVHCEAALTTDPPQMWQSAVAGQDSVRARSMSSHELKWFIIALYCIVYI